VRALQGLCTISDRGADKDTVRVELDLGGSGLGYAPGDALGVYPENQAAVRGVRRVLERVLGCVVGLLHCSFGSFAQLCSCCFGVATATPAIFSRTNLSTQPL